MQIFLNNNLEIFPEEQLTIADVIRIKNYTFKLLVIKLNNCVIQKTDCDKTYIKEGDDLKIIHLMSGG